MFNFNKNPGKDKSQERLTANAQSCLAKSAEIARKSKSRKIENIHLLYAIQLESSSLGCDILQGIGLRKKHFNELLDPAIRKKETGPISVDQEIPLSEELRKCLIKAYSVAKDFGYPYVGTEHLAYALLESQSPSIKKILARIDMKKIPNSLQPSDNPGQISAIANLFNFPEFALGKRTSHLGSELAFISKFCIDMNEKVRAKKEPIIGREKEISRIISVLGRKSKNNPLLIGHPGIGKTALVMKLAELINSDSVPSFLFRKRIMNLDIAALVAGTSFRGEFETRLKEVIREAANNRDIILFIDEIHNMIGAGNNSGSLDLANILKPALANGEIQLIGATTFAEFKRHFEKDSALERRFQSIQVDEPKKDEAKLILMGIKEHYEKFHDVTIDPTVIDSIVDFSDRYIQHRFFPDKAIDVLDEAAANLRAKNGLSESLRSIRKLEEKAAGHWREKEQLVSNEEFEKAAKLKKAEDILHQQIEILKKENPAGKNERLRIKEEDIIEIISRISNIPADKLSEKSGHKIKNVAEILNAQVIGQNEAIGKISSVLIRSQFGISSPEKPLGSFLFLGPSGIGKTFTAKILAREFFGETGSLIRIDMSEFVERHSISGLIGSPAGYIGYGEGGRLTEKVRRNPYSVVLFDEIEKAHPDVFNILLQILEDGKLTDAAGMEVNFKNTIIILTSNVETEGLLGSASIGFGNSEAGIGGKPKEDQKEKIISGLKDKLRPELLNRLDNLIIFNPLGQKEIERITELELEKLAERLKSRGIGLAFEKAAIQQISKLSFGPQQGARLIRRNIQEMIEEKIANMIMDDEISDGRIVAVRVEKEKIIIA